MSKNRFQDREGPSQRQLRVGEVIRRALAEILARGDVHDPDLSLTPITVGEVRCSPDLRQATVFFMPLGGVRREEVLAALKRNKAEIRHLVSQSVRLKYAPDLSFKLDESFDRMDDTRRILNSPEVRRDLDEE